MIFAVLCTRNARTCHTQKNKENAASNVVQPHPDDGDMSPEINRRDTYCNRVSHENSYLAILHTKKSLEILCKTDSYLLM